MTYTVNGDSSSPYQDAFNKYGSKAAAARALGLAVQTFKDRLNKELSGGPKIATTHPPIQISPSKGFTKVLFFTDAHNMPGMSLDRFVWLGSLIDDTAPDILLDGGDFDDFQSLCSHEGNETYKGKLKPSLARDLEASALARKTLASSHSHKCRKIATLGNHEHRLWNYENANPEMYGITTNIYTDILKATGWKYSMYGAYVEIDGVRFTHIPFNGMGKPVGGDNAVKQVAEKSTQDTVFGHVHYEQKIRANKFGDNISVTAFSGSSFMPHGYVGSYAKNTRKEHTYGCHILTIKDGRIKSVKTYCMEELEALYG